MIRRRRLRSLNIHQSWRRSIQWLQWKAVIVCYRWSSVSRVKLLLIYSTISSQPRFTLSSLLLIACIVVWCLYSVSKISKLHFWHLIDYAAGIELRSSKDTIISASLRLWCRYHTSASGFQQFCTVFLYLSVSHFSWVPIMWLNIISLVSYCICVVLL